MEPSVVAEKRRIVGGARYCRGYACLLATHVCPKQVVTRGNVGTIAAITMDRCHAVASCRPSRWRALGGLYWGEMPCTRSG